MKYKPFIGKERYRILSNEYPALKQIITQTRNRLKYETVYEAFY